jgi:hypothetical protein
VRERTGLVAYRLRTPRGLLGAVREALSGQITKWTKRGSLNAG